jgi:hypothetical protein
LKANSTSALRLIEGSPLGPWIVFILLLAPFNAIFAPFIPLPDFRLGHDFSFVLPNLLDGNIWFRNNGFAPPWFSPSFCAGQPSFPDPQSSYYGVLQFLSIAASPLTAIRWTLLICASLMFWGGYLLLRRIFAVGTTSALLVGGLLMFNGFLPHRIIIGHTGFHGFALVPWIALLLMMQVRHVANGIAAAATAGILSAYWLYSGFTILVPAGVLSILLLAILYGLAGGNMARFCARGALAGLICLGLSAAKLWASFSFFSNFSRNYYLLPGAASIHDAAIVIAGSLFLPSQWAFELGMPRMKNLQWELTPHEWAFNFGIFVVPMAAVLIANRLRKSSWCPTLSPRQIALCALMILCLAWPLAFNVWHPRWNAFLKMVPILNTTSSPLRWLIAYIPVVAVGVGLGLDKAGWTRGGALAAAGCMAATILQTAVEPREYYMAQSYDARPVLIADNMLREGRWSPKIEVLGTGAEIQAGDYRTQLHSNDTFVVGMSQVFCYNAVFGYRLEKFSAAGLVAGSVLQEHEGFLNLKNPSCYVFPNENKCLPGDRFRADQLAQARSFTEYRPFAFQISAGQAVANQTTLLSLLVIILGALIWLLKALPITALWRKTVRPTPPPSDQ